MASIRSSALVIEGVSRTRNALINGLSSKVFLTTNYNWSAIDHSAGDWENYDWDTGYTCHQLGSGAIVVQLSQPFMIDSMRLLLWDTDKRSYSYYIEVSVDQQNWHIVADKRKEFCRSWQLLRFERRPVVFIRIVGTYNSANEVFHCVHFECPAQLSDPQTPIEYNKNDNLNIDEISQLLETSDDNNEIENSNQNFIQKHFE